jgi:plasmid maintenance system antidote protein VapI
MPPIHPGEILLEEFLDESAGRYDLEIEKDRLGAVLNDIRPLSTASR